MIEITAYKCGVHRELHRIFFDTVRRIKSRDYTQAQLKAWAPTDADMRMWKDRFDTIKPYLAYQNNEIAGFADIQDDGYIDMFFCRADMQGMGVGRALMFELIKEARSKNLSILFSHVSITAKPFFEKFGFETLRAQDVEVADQVLRNFVMQLRIGSI